MVNNIIQVVYTNSNVKDVFVPFYKQNRKYCEFPLYVISDFDVKEDVNGMYGYDNSQPYYDVWINALKQFDSKYFIYLQEDFILYDNVNHDIIKRYKDLLEENDKYSFVRLIKSGRLQSSKIYDNLYEIEPTNENIFAMQATLWKTDDYISLLDNVKEATWFEVQEYRSKMIEMDMYGLYYYDNERKIGKNHFDSRIYPYIATAVVKGKWNFKEYKQQLEPILAENNIDISKKGVT